MYEKDPTALEGEKNINLWQRAKAILAIGAVSLGLGHSASAHAEDTTSNMQGLNLPQLRLFDVGVTDYNHDGLLDIFSTAHSFTPGLLQNTGDGNFVNVTNEVGFSLNPEFPGLENVNKEPTFTQPGLYTYLSRVSKKSKRSDLVVTAYGVPSTGSITFNPSRTIRGLEVLGGSTTTSSGQDEPQKIDFNLESGGKITLDITTQIPVKISSNTDTFVGSDAVKAMDSNDVNVVTPDRHAETSVDFNGDGLDDVMFVNGGLGGDIYDPAKTGFVKDNTLIYQNDHYEEVNSGQVKGACRGRQAASIDANGDGRVDLFQSCEGDRPIINMQTDTGWNRLAIPAEGSIYRWIQSGKSTIPKLLALGKRATLLTFDVDHFERIDSTKLSGASLQTTLADYNNDGNPDIMVNSPRGNSLITVHGSHLKYHDPTKVGLPKKSSVGAFVDANNDGRIDYHGIPEGLYLQGKRGDFDKTGRLKVNTSYGHLSWGDFNNDGKREPIIGTSKREFGERGKVFMKGVAPNGSWLEVDLPGAWQTSQVTVKTPQKRKPLYAWAGQSNTSHFSEGHNRLYFTWPNSPKHAIVRVKTPDGRVFEQNTETNQVIQIP